MWSVVKRLSLGVTLIVLTSAVLLVSDRDNRTASDRRPRVALVSFASVLIFEDSMQQAASLGDRLIMMHRGQILHDFSGAERQRLRPEGLMQRFEDIRGADLLDESAAAFLRRTYV
jgi:hypothetical protein